MPARVTDAVPKGVAMGVWNAIDAVYGRRAGTSAIAYLVALHRSTWALVEELARVTIPVLISHTIPATITVAVAYALGAVVRFWSGAPTKASLVALHASVLILLPVIARPGWRSPSKRHTFIPIEPFLTLTKPIVADDCVIYTMKAVLRVWTYTLSS
jgi:hypothetical protein